MRELPIVVLISGRGSNLQALLDAIENDGLPVTVRAVISDRADAHGLTLAARAGIVTAVVERGQDRALFEQALRAQIDAHAPDLVMLAGFMRVLSPAFVEHYRGRMLNIHPSLLPLLPGLNTHARALQEKHSHHGASVHFVTAEVDGGPLIVQACVPVMANDTADTLAARVLEQEHCIYPLVLRWFAEDRLRMHGERVFLDGRALERPLQYPLAATR